MSSWWELRVVVVVVVMLARGGQKVAVQAQVGSDEKGGVMKYHSLSRRELQTLCKEYHIPANKSNVAMAQALAALHNTAAPSPGTKLLTVGRPSTVTTVEGARLKPLETKQSSRLSLVSRRSDQQVVRSEAGGKKLPAQSCKKLIPAINVLNGSASCRQTFETAQTDSSSSQAATRMMPTRNSQGFKLRPRPVNGSERTLSREPCTKLLPSISPIEKSKMGRTKPFAKRELSKEVGAMAVKCDAIYKPSGKENFARNVKTMEKSSLRNEENCSIQKCLQPEEMRRNMRFNNCVKTAATVVKPLSSDWNSYAAKAPHDEAFSIAIGWENAAAAEKESFPAIMVERSIGARSFCADDNHPEEVLIATCHNKRVPSSLQVSAAVELGSKAEESRVLVATTTQAKGTVRSCCLEEELSHTETSSGLKESDAGFVSVPTHLSPLNIRSVKSENSSTLSTQRSVIDYILLPPWSPPKTSVVAEQSVCHRRSKRLTTNQKTAGGGGGRNWRENGTAAAEQPLRRNDYLMRSLRKLHTSIRGKVMRKDKVEKL